VTITDSMLHVLHHTLGLRPDHRESYRNYYLAGPGHHSQADLEALESAGLMKRVPTPAFCADGDITFVCSEAGRAYAIEHLPPAPKRTKFEEYLCIGDCFDSFAQFLGINKPIYETRGYGSTREYRMFRRDLSVSWSIYPEVAGDWKPTKKAAKESYKSALETLKKRLSGKSAIRKIVWKLNDATHK
jgi:hypothetical protein